MLEVNVEQQKQLEAQANTFIDDTNWKNKYDILNQLKENEKVVPSNLITAIGIPTKDTKEQRNEDIKATHFNMPEVYPSNSQVSVLPTHFSNLQTLNDIRAQEHGDCMTQAQRETVEHNIVDQHKAAGPIEQIQSHLDPKSQDIKIKQVTQEDAVDSRTESPEAEQNVPVNYHVSSMEYRNHDHEGAQENFVNISASKEILQGNSFSSTDVKPEIEAINQYNNPMQQYTEISEQSESIQYTINTHPDVFTPTDGVVLEDRVNVNRKEYVENEQSECAQYPMNMNSEEIASNDVVLQETVNVHSEEYDGTQQLEYPIDVINPDEFTPNDGVVLEDGVNINPEGYEGINNYSIENLSHHPGNVGDVNQLSAPVLEQSEMEENVVEKGIEDFETEQRNMWQESPSENAAYSQEAYEQPNQYYYEQGQEYPVEVNEHEETQSNYDPSYQQQYDNQYQAEYQQETQQYDQSQAYTEGYDQNYGAQPLYDGYNEEAYQNQQQMHETPQTIEQDLNSEQGFLEHEEAPDTNAQELPENIAVNPTE